MNRRQKLVQKQFLNNEQAVIKRLEQVYAVALKDIDGKIEALMKRFDPDTGDLPQSVIYQLKYQEMVKAQVEGALKQLQTKQFLTVSDYLDACYEDGFVGSIFDLHGQDVPLTMPIDQQSMVRAVQLESKISEGLYTRMGEDVDLLRKKITAQVSRSIATGVSFEQTARQLAGYTRIGYNKAVRIARTEGHRIQCTAADDAAHAARDRGADVLKQWDATLDGATRESHIAVDGEIRELDEKFSNGLMFPGDPAGGAAEVINCRCAYLQRARWAVGGSFTKWNNFTDQLETFDSPEAYEEFKKGFFSPENKKYMNYVEQMQDKYGTKDFKKVLDSMTDREYKRYFGLLKNNPVYNTKAPEPVKKVTMHDRMIGLKFNGASTVAEAEQYADRFVEAYKSKYSGNVSFKGMDVEHANAVNRVLTTVYDAYDIPPHTDITVMNFREARWKTAVEDGIAGAYQWGGNGGRLFINQKLIGTSKVEEAFIKKGQSLLKTVIDGAGTLLNGSNLRPAQRTYIEALVKSGVQCMSQKIDAFTEATIVHEMGHSLEDKLFWKMFKTSKNPDGFDVRASMEKYAGGISGYATSSAREYIAESFTAWWYGMDDIVDPGLAKIFEGAMKK